MASRFGGIPINEGQSRFGGLPINAREEEVPGGPSYLERIGMGTDQAISNIGNIFANNQNPTTSAIKVGGQVANVLASPITEAFGSLMNTAPDSVKKKMQDASAKISGLYQGGIDNLANTSGGRAFGDYGMESPRLQAIMQEASDTAKGAGSIASIYPISRAANVAIKGAESVAPRIAEKIAANPIYSDIGSGVSVNAALANVPKGVASAVEGVGTRYKGATKALKPEDLDELLVGLKDHTSDLYKAVDDAGAKIRPETAQRLNNEILSSVQNIQINPAASPKTLGAVKELYNRITIGKTNPITGEVTQAPLSVSELDGYRKLLGGIQGEDAVVANKVREVIDNQLAAMTTKDFVGGGTQAPKLLFEARNAASKAFKVEQISDIIKKAAGSTRAIKAGFTKLTEKKNWERGFTPSEITAIKEAADSGTGELIERGIGTFGLDFGKVKNVGLPVLTGGSVGLGVPGGIPLVTAGTVLRQTGKYAARGKAQNVIDEILSRPQKTPDISQDVFTPESAARTTATQSKYADIDSKVSSMRAEFKSTRLKSLDKKMKAGIITPKEMYERELLKKDMP